MGRKTEDRLEDAAWLYALFEKYGLQANGPIDAVLIDRFKELRLLMRDILDRLTVDYSLEHAGVERLNCYLLTVGYSYAVEYRDGKLQLLQVPLEKNNGSLLGQIAVSLVELLTENDIRRVKICKNPDCRWVFFDASKNRNKCWCDSKICGNLMKVRSFRERKKLDQV